MGTDVQASQIMLHPVASGLAADHNKWHLTTICYNKFYTRLQIWFSSIQLSASVIQLLFDIVIIRRVRVLPGVALYPVRCGVIALYC